MTIASPIKEGLPSAHSPSFSKCLTQPSSVKGQLNPCDTSCSTKDLNNNNTSVSNSKTRVDPQHQKRQPSSLPLSSMKMSKLLAASLLVLCSILAPAASKSASNKNEKRVVCYYTNWSAYRQGPAKFLPDNINPYLCTHLVYAFGGLTSEQGIKPFDKYQDIDKGGYTKFNGLKTYNKALKTMIAIGGWNEGSRRFSNLVADEDSRKNFIKLAIRFLRQYQFDGLDLDWEYPASREGGVPEDKKNYAQFIKELREAFEEESKSTGRARLLLTVAVPAGIEWIQKGFDIPVINRNIDFFNLLTYDYHASTEPNANHHAPLKARDGLSEYDWKGQLNIEYSINYYLKEGADPDKLVVGLPTYGRSYNLFNVESYDIDAPSSGPGTKGKYTKEPGYLAYYEICEGVKSGEWRVENADSDTQGPHAVKHDQWVGYDDTRMMAIKSKWVKDNGLGGIMFWSVDNDDFRGACHGKPFPLIEAAKLAYLTGDAPTTHQQASSSTSKLSKPSLLNRPSSSNRFTSLNRRVTTPAPPTTTTGGPAKSRRKKNRNKNRRNKNKKNRTTPTTEGSTTTTTTEPPTTHNPLSTPAPPTTPDPGVDFECKDDGFFPHPRDCKKYFWCLEAPGLGLVAHHFTCPAGLFFNKNTDSCDYARNVPCKDKNAATTATTAAVVTTTTTTTKPTTTTTRRTTTTRPTTTTTEAPEDDEDYDDEEYEDEEEEEEQPVKTVATNTKGGKGKSEDINDIKNLLKLIKKLGGVEELEKYLNDNPSVAAAIEEYEDEEEEEEKPAAKPVTTSSNLFNRNRFTPTSTSSTPGSSRRFGTSSPAKPSNSPIAASSLKYTSIQRNRPSTTTTEKSVDDTNNDPESSEDEDSIPKRKTPSSLFSSSNRPKYVTLSRNSNNNRDSKSTEKLTTEKFTSTTTEKSPPSSPSSTETSIVVRYSGDEDKLLDEIKNNTDTGPEGDAYADDDDDNDEDSEGDSNNKTIVVDDSNTERKDRYVTFSRPYAKVSGSVEAQVPNISNKTPRNANPNLKESTGQSNRLRYVQLSRTRTTDLKTDEAQNSKKSNKDAVEIVAAENTKEQQEETSSEELKDDDNYESEEEPNQSIIEDSTNTPSQTSPTTPSTTTTTRVTTTTESPSSPTTKPRIRIPTRKTNGFAARTRGTTPATSRPSKLTTTLEASDSTNTNTLTSDPSTSATTSTDDSKPKPRSNFAVGNRRNLFQSRTRGTSTTSVPDAASSQSAKDESITEVVELISRAEAISRRLDEQLASEQPTKSTRTRSRSIGSSTTSSPNALESSSKDTRADINSISRSRSRSRFRPESKIRSTTEQSAASQSTTPLPILFRRRHRTSTTQAPTTATTRTTTRPTKSTTTTTTTTTKKPTTVTSTSTGGSSRGTTTFKASQKPNDDEEEAEYYYYYYDEDEPTATGSGGTSSTGEADILDKSQTQRTTGLRTQDFSPSTISSLSSSAGGGQSRPSIIVVGADRGFTKRNLQTSNLPPKVKQPSSTTIAPRRDARVIQNTNSNVQLNTNSFNPGLSHHKWSQRAVVPLSEKIRLRTDGSVECLDKGIFPHPISCKQFVHCVTSEENDGSIRAWVYACPKLLTFDPIGGMCNYDEFAYSKRAPAGNACIE